MEGRGLGKHAASVFGVLLSKSGVAPCTKIRSWLSLSLQDREEISRGLVAGFSMRKIAEHLDDRRQLSAVKSSGIMDDESIGPPMLTSALGAKTSTKQGQPRNQSLTLY